MMETQAEVVRRFLRVATIAALVGMLAGSGVAAGDPPVYSWYFPHVVHNAHVGPCTTHTVEMDLSAVPATLRVGETATVTATLRNTGCVGVGLPLYRLYFEEGQGVLGAPDPAEVLHYRMVGPLQDDVAQFTLQALAPGRAAFRATVSFEVHLGYPGPAYWAGAGSGVVEVRVLAAY